MTTTLRISLTWLLLAAPAGAQSVFFVDDTPGPGVDFTNLQAAVDATMPGDRIEVFEGGYGSVTVNKGITVMAVVPNTVTVGVLRVENLPATETAVLVDLRAVSLVTENSTGSIIVDGGQSSLGLRATDADDVRIRATQLSSGLTMIERSFVQVAQSWVEGPVRVVDSEAVLTDCTIRGQRGFNAPDCFSAGGPGSAGVRAIRSELWVLRSSVGGGDGGFGCFIGSEGPAGPAFWAEDSTIRECRSTLLAPTYSLNGTSQRVLANDLPSTTLEGGNQVGEAMSFVIQAGAGTSTRVFAGRRAQRTPFGDTLDILHSSERGISLGFMVPSERRLIPFTIPVLPRGTLVYIQARRTLANGDTENSNSHPLVVR